MFRRPNILIVGISERENRENGGEQDHQINYQTVFSRTEWWVFSWKASWELSAVDESILTPRYIIIKSQHWRPWKSLQTSWEENKSFHVKDKDTEKHQTFQQQHCKL